MFSNTIPSEAAKKAKTVLIKCYSLELSFDQSVKSALKSISSAVQKLATCFLYISQT